VSNSKQLIGFFNKNNSTEKKLSKEDFKKFAQKISKNYLWIPLHVEKLYAQKIYEDRVNSGDVILKNTKSRKYKKMYAKLDKFLEEYNEFLKKENLKYPFDIKIYILATQKKVEALPYGYVFISEDYIEKNSYRTVLAHELSHISKRHTTKEIQYAIVSTYDNISQVTSMIKNMQDNDVEDKVVLGFLTPEIIKRSFEHYAREQEIEADACGFRIMNQLVPNQKETHVNNFIKNINYSEITEDALKEKSKDHPDRQARIENLKKIEKILK
jgi:Zn-dependent protease with chaperone function